MVDLRKWFPALVVVALLLSTAVTASAQPAFSCAAAQGVPTFVRAEGVAELVGDVVLNCTGGTPTPNGVPVPLLNISVFLNTDITSKILQSGNVVNPLTEALLLVDEALPSQQSPCFPGAGETDPLAFCPIIGTGLAGTVNTTTGVTTPGGVNYRAGGDGVFNVFQGRLVNEAFTGRSYLSWTGIPIDPPGTIGTRVIRISNIRARATGTLAGVPTSFLPSINAIVTITAGSAPLAISQPTGGISVGFPVQGLAAVNVTRTGGDGPLQFRQCNEATAAGPNVTLNIREGFPSSFKPRLEGLVFATPDGLGVVQPIPGFNAALPPSSTGFVQATPNQNIFSESGFVNPDWAGTPLAGAGLATNGTRILLRLQGLPTSNVNVWAGQFEAGSTAANSRLVAVATDANGANASGVSGFSAVTPQTQGGISVVPVTIGSNGTATLVYEVVAADPTVIETFRIPIIVTFAAGQTQPLTTAPTVTATLAPISTNNTSTPPGVPVPRFSGQTLPNPAADLFTIVSCRTNLLFPYVTNSNNYNTGIAISNTSRDIYGTTPQSGACTMNFMRPAGATQIPAATSGTVEAGATLLFLISGPGSDATLTTALGTSVRNFDGYMIAQCNFQFAHGFAFIMGPGGQVAHGYLALVMDQTTSSRTGPTGVSEGLLQ